MDSEILVATHEGLMPEAEYREMVTRRRAKQRTRDEGIKYTQALREERERYDRENHDA